MLPWLMAVVVILMGKVLAALGMRRQQQVGRVVGTH
jgi:hypothetical protein